MALQRVKLTAAILNEKAAQKQWQQAFSVRQMHEGNIKDSRSFLKRVNAALTQGHGVSPGDEIARPIAIAETQHDSASQSSLSSVQAIQPLPLLL